MSTTDSRGHAGRITDSHAQARVTEECPECLGWFAFKDRRCPFCEWDKRRAVKSTEGDE